MVNDIYDLFFFLFFSLSFVVNGEKKKPHPCSVQNLKPEFKAAARTLNNTLH